MEFVIETHDGEALRTSLNNWFRFDHLTSEQGLAMLAGISPNSSRRLSDFLKRPSMLKLEQVKSLISLDDAELVIPKNKTEKSSIFRKIIVKEIYDYDNNARFEGLVAHAYHYRMLHEYWKSGNHPEITPALYFVEWSKKKGIAPDWLSIAENMGLIPPDDAPAIENKLVAENDRAHISNNLAILNQAAKKFWANADRDDRTTHPKKNDVVAWLIQRGFSQKLADSGATIIRPDWAPTGRIAEE